MSSSDYLKNYIDQIEHIRVETAHDQHILEFRAMCAKMIEEAMPKIRDYVKQEIMADLRQQYNKTEQPKQQEVEAVFSPEQVKTSLFDAIKRAFRR